jgi:hypothetical protein
MDTSFELSLDLDHHCHLFALAAIHRLERSKCQPTSTNALAEIQRLSFAQLQTKKTNLSAPSARKKCQEATKHHPFNSRGAVGLVKSPRKTRGGLFAGDFARNNKKQGGPVCTQNLA